MMTPNYLSPPQLPLAFTATAESIREDNDNICAGTQAVLDKIASTVAPAQATFDNVLRPIAHSENQRQLVTGVLDLLVKVSDNINVRNAAADAEKGRSRFMVDHGMRDDIFQLVDAVFQKDKATDAESTKFLVENRRNFVRSGLLLTSQSDRDRLKEIRKRLSAITADFVRNLDEEDAHIWFTRDQLTGIPDDVQERLKHGTEEMDGKIKVGLEGPDFMTVIRFARSEDTRREIYTARANKGKLNIPLFAEAIRLRDEASRILGYTNHAAYKLETKMAKTPKVAMAFLTDLHERASRYITGDIEELLKMKREELASSSSSLSTQGSIQLYKWDVSYYTRLLQEQQYSVDHLKISEYFPLQSTITAMVRLFGDLFGFIFVELKDDDRTKLSATGDGKELTWHDEVILYSVWNDEKEGSEFVGYLYMDLHPRPGKYNGAQCHPIQLGFSRPDGQRHYPSTALIANFAKSAFLKHSDMMMLFHELGHGIHDLSGLCQYSRFHGAETVSDFNEAPSQMLENWCWDRDGLRQLSSHYETGQPLPDDMIDALVRSKHLQASMALMQQLRVFLFDMAVHSTAPGEDGEVDVQKIWCDYVDIGGVQGPEDKHGYASLKHLFTGYDAGFYSYLWSKVHAMDIFDAAFREDVLDSEQGRRYRHMVLEKGGSQDEMLTLADFLGRDPKPDAFLQDLNLN